MKATSLRNRRRFVVSISAALTLIVIESAIRYLQPALAVYKTSHYDRVQAGLRAAGRPDVALMGSSRVRFALDPVVFEEILGVPAHNVGVSASRVVEWNVFAKRLFAEAPPRLVVLGINAWEVAGEYRPTEAAEHLFTFDDFLESLSADGFSLDVAGAYARRSVGPLWKTFDSRRELLLWGQERFEPILPKYAQLAREQRMRVAEPRAANGYDHPWSHGRRLANLEQKAAAGVLEVAEERPPEFDPDAYTYQRLGSLLDWLDARGCRVVVAYLPNSPRAQARWSGVEPEMRSRIAAVCAERGTPFLHWDQFDLPRSDADFLDETHVGWALAKEISCRVAEEIRALALLEPAATAGDARLASKEVEP